MRTTHDANDGAVEQLGRDFASPPREFRPLAWWMLNGDLKPDVMRRQLEKFAEYGFGGYATYPYRGLTVPYHSEAWWQAVRRMLESSRDLGLDVWPLDEFNWPSGHCAGYVLRDQPWLRSVLLHHRHDAVEANAEATLRIDGEVLSVMFESDGGITPAADWRIETAPEETRLHWMNRTGVVGRLHVVTRAPQRFAYYFAYGAPWALGPAKAWGNLDVLNPNGIRASLQYTQEQYAARFPELLGSTIKGFFTDENVLSASGGLAYTPSIEDEFMRRYGYHLRPRIHELFLATRDYLTLRYNYWRIVTDWVGAHYYGPYRQWCDDHNLALIGHLCGEEAIGSNVGLNGDVFEAGQRLTHPGVDMLYGVTGYDAPDKWNRPGNHYADADIRSFHMTMKLAQSTVKHAGATRMFDEAFCCEDYAANPRDLKRSCNYYAAFGVSQLLVSDFNYSHAGIRKRRGGSKCFGTPWNRYYRQITDYIGRLSVFAAAGRPKAEIGILYPRATAWCHYRGPETAVIDGLLHGLLDALIRSHWQCDFVYEQLLEQAHVGGGLLKLPPEEYRVLIAPGCKTLTAATLSKLEQFVASGGVLLVMLPFGEDSPDCADVVRRSQQMLESATCFVWQLPEDAAAARKTCDETLGRWLRKPLALTGDAAAEMVVAHRVVGTTDMFLVANMGPEHADLTVGSGDRREWELWDLESRERSAIEVPALMRFAPGEAVVLCGGARSSGLVVHGAAPARAVQAGKAQTISGPWRFALDGPNQFRLDARIRYDADGVGLQQRWQESRNEDGWEPLVDHVSQRDLDARFMPAYWLGATFAIEHLPDDLELVVDSDLVTHAFVNGREATGVTSTMLYHHENRAFPVRELVHPGHNDVTLRCATESLNLERICNMPAAPVVLTGSFSVDGGALIAPKTEMPVGPWHENGYPHLAGTAVYETEFEWQGRPRVAVWLDLGGVGDVAEASMNGIALGCRLWPPYRFDVTDALHQGRNTLRIAVTSGIGNLLPYGYTDQLVPGPVAYGLLEAPVLIEVGR